MSEILIRFWKRELERHNAMTKQFKSNWQATKEFLETERNSINVNMTGPENPDVETTSVQILKAPEPVKPKYKVIEFKNIEEYREQVRNELVNLFNRTDEYQRKVVITDLLDTSNRGSRRRFDRLVYKSLKRNKA